MVSGCSVGLFIPTGTIGRKLTSAIAARGNPDIRVESVPVIGDIEMESRAAAGPACRRCVNHPYPSEHSLKFQLMTHKHSRNSALRRVIHGLLDIVFATNCGGNLSERRESHRLRDRHTLA